jgi:4-amino-4-deoxy-L-arabinose transferase-like glycosyltransferase
MLQRGSFYDLTWNGRLNFQNAPLQFWILARWFELFGYDDFAARLPSILIALWIFTGISGVARRKSHR